MTLAREPFSYTGLAELREAVTAALHRVVDPEMSVDIVELGLVYAVEALPGRVKARITMTSAACPVTELIVEEAVGELGNALGPGVAVDVEVVWDPPWDPERMSAKARYALGWE
jgi:metal-sulfur cluster biosynthetic enzyme